MFTSDTISIAALRKDDPLASALDARSLDLVPAAIFVCDTAGAIRIYNRHAVELWDHEPTPGESARQLCERFRLFDANGRPGRIPEALAGIETLVAGSETPDEQRSLKVTLHHSGTGSIAPARATLLAGQRQARLRVGKVRLNRGKGQLRIRGRISPRIPGKLALKLLPTDAGQGKAIQLKAKIKRGRWQLTRRLPGLGPEHRRLVIAYRGNAARSVAGTQFVRGL